MAPSPRIALFCDPAQPFARGLLEHVGPEACLLDARAAERGLAASVFSSEGLRSAAPSAANAGRTPGEVGRGGDRAPRCELAWQGADLSACRCAWIDRPPFAWPQSQRGPSEREARSLAVAFLWTLGRRARLVNAPPAWELAAAPLVALERLAAAGVDVRPYVLQSAEARATGMPGRVWLDCVGRTLDSDPSADALVDGPMWSPEPSAAAGAGASLEEWLVLGGQARARVRHAGLWEWASALGERSRTNCDWREPRQGHDERAGQLAEAAAAALGLDVATIAVDAQGAVLAVDAGCDLAPWDEATDGRVRLALAEHLRACASERHPFPDRSTEDTQEERA